MRVEEKHQIKGQSKYITDLLKANEIREAEKNLMREKVERLERIRETGDQEERERFITDSYMKLLEQNKRLERIHQVEE